jgi:hypothetical protein
MAGLSGFHSEKISALLLVCIGVAALVVQILSTRITLEGGFLVFVIAVFAPILLLMMDFRKQAIDATSNLVITSKTHGIEIDKKQRKEIALLSEKDGPLFIINIGSYFTIEISFISKRDATEILPSQRGKVIGKMLVIPKEDDVVVFAMNPNNRPIKLDLEILSKRPISVGRGR